MLGPAGKVDPGSSLRAAPKQVAVAMACLCAHVWVWDFTCRAQLKHDWTTWKQLFHESLQLFGVSMQKLHRYT